VRGKTTILRVFKGNDAQFVYQKGALRRSPAPIEAADPPSRGRFAAVTGRLAGAEGAGPAESSGPGNRAFTMTPKCRWERPASCRKGSQTLGPRAIELSVHLSPL
jgi:hypothetical protein